MGKRLVITFDIPSHMLAASGDRATMLMDEAMRFRSQEEALTYIDKHRKVLDSIGPNPIPSDADD